MSLIVSMILSISLSRNRYEFVCKFDSYKLINLNLLFWGNVAARTFFLVNFEELKCNLPTRNEISM